MNRYDFFDKLTKALSGIPKEEVKKTIDYYSEIIDDAVEDGEVEETVIERLGNIDDIADKIISETPEDKIEGKNSENKKMSTVVIILLIVGFPIWFPILIAVFAVAFSLYAALWSIILALFSVTLGLGASSLVLIAVVPFVIIDRPLAALCAFGEVLVSAGLAVFMFYLSVWSAKMAIRFTKFLAKKIKGIFINETAGTNQKGREEIENE